MYSTARGSFALFSSVVSAGRHTYDQACGNITDGNPADYGQKRQAYTAVNSAAESESRRYSERKCNERFVFDELPQIAAPGATRRRRADKSVHDPAILRKNAG
jgi:hypothetical protein